MLLKYDIEIDNEEINNNLIRISNRIFKLLPDREEGKDWQSALHNLIIELGGMSSLLNGQIDLFRLLSRLESLTTLIGEDDFLEFRKGIFECLSLLKKAKECLSN